MYLYLQDERMYRSHCNKARVHGDSIVIDDDVIDDDVIDDDVIATRQEYIVTASSLTMMSLQQGKSTW